METESEWGEYVPAFTGSNGINKLLAMYFGIDLDKVEAEHMEILKWLQEAQS